MSALSLDYRLFDRSQKTGFLVVIALRALLFTLVIFGLNGIFALGTAPVVLSLSAVAGSFLGSRLAFTRCSTRGSLSLIALLYAGLWLALKILEFGPQLFSQASFRLFDFSLHTQLTIAAFSFAFFSAWCFWRIRHAATLELLIFLFAAITLFSGHRNFHFDSPQVVNTLAWWFKVEQISMLIALGTGLFLLVTTYLYCATLPMKPDTGLNGSTSRFHAARPKILASSLVLAILGVCLYLIITVLYGQYDEIARTRAANGVGEASGEGMSPLGFHSALGSTNQPAALVRLEGDYKENPFSPMLYLRESALSEFSGRELTIANRTFDRDVPNITPGETFQGDEDIALQLRVPLVYSTYLLTEHRLAFAVDYPLSVKPIRNPNPARFKGAFRAYSVAPGFQLADLADQQVGDPRWTPEERKHYLTPHTDVRYGALAQEISAGYSNPVQKAVSIIQYFNKTAVYTLTPNHDVKPDQDPVAPFVFGDHRGYCVHFAHAAVYLFRALGIPARIATGYLTDLSQARDGHILLRMSDRHAWAEIFVQNYGWVPFDIQPEQVESHADTQVDMKTLEELMNLLEPDEEILPKDVLKGEAAAATDSPLFLPNSRHLGLLLASILTLYLLVKLYLRYSWALPGSTKSQMRRSYIAILSKLHDLGFRRSQGETRAEFRTRIEKTLGLETLRLTELQQISFYAAQSESRITSEAIRATLLRDRESLHRLPLLRRIIAACNPASVIHTIFGATW